MCLLCVRQCGAGFNGIAVVLDGFAALFLSQKAAHGGCSMTLLSSCKTLFCFFDIMGTFIFSNAFLFVDSAVILVDPRRSKLNAPAILQNAPMIFEDAPVIFIKQKSVRTQPPCADFSAKTPHFHAPPSDSDACISCIGAPAPDCNAKTDDDGGVSSTKSTNFTNDQTPHACRQPCESLSWIVWISSSNPFNTQTWSFVSDLLDSFTRDFGVFNRQTTQ